MKKFILAFAILFGTLGYAQAQTTPTVIKQNDQTKKESKKEKKAQAKAQQDAQNSSDKATGLKKDGTPDMRLKVNKNKVQPASPAPAAPSQPVSRQQNQPIAPAPASTKSPVSPSSNPKTADKVLETDAKGRTIYLGPRGGKYYINKNGHKEYIKQ